MSADSRSRTQRRKSPRIELDAPILGENLTTGRSVHLLDVSLGGFRTFSPTPGRPGMRHTFRFIADGEVSRITAAAVHSQRATGESPYFLVGWQAEDDAISQQGLHRLIAAATTAPVTTDEEGAVLYESGGAR